MRSTVFVVVLLSVVLSIAGCGAVQSRPLEIRGLVIRNETGSDIRDFQLLVEKTRTTVTCSYIPAGKQFSTEFPLREYQHNYIIASWQQNGRSFQSPRMYAQVPEDIDTSVAVHGEMIITQNGRIVVQLVPGAVLR